MIESIRNAYALPDLRRRILYTILVLVIYRLVANIPAPGVNLAAWLQFTSGATTGNRFLDVLDLLSGGAVRNFSVMAMGVYPYITASIILQLLTPLIPQLEELQAEGESGRNKITRITYFLTVPLAILQAVGQIRLVGFSLGGMETIMPFFGFGNATETLATLTTLLAMTRHHTPSGSASRSPKMGRAGHLADHLRRYRRRARESGPAVCAGH